MSGCWAYMLWRSSFHIEQMLERSNSQGNSELAISVAHLDTIHHMGDLLGAKQ
jgi:hypothetical protein